MKFSSNSLPLLREKENRQKSIRLMIDRNYQKRVFMSRVY